MACRLAAIFSILALSLHLPSLSGNATTFTITNNCDYTVWPGILSNAGVTPLSTTGFALHKGETRSINPPSGWAGRLWGRTFCSTDQKTGKFTCLTGDCGSGKIDCSGAGALPPATLAEFTLDGSGGMDFYDLSLVDGYNLAMVVAPRGGGGPNCSFIGCVSDLNGACPSELRVTSEGEENVVACRSPCDVFGTPEYCCSRAYASPDTCKPTTYSLAFKKACPHVYSYAYDDKSSTFTCNGSPDYTITFFCPTPSTRKEKKTKEMEVIVGIVVPIAVMGLLIALYSTYHIRRKAKMSLFLDIRNVLEDLTTAESLTFELETLQVATNFFSNDRKLGGGGFGNVYKGTLPNGQDIAVKRLSRISDQGIESFKNEAVLIAKLQHKNLVKLLGFCLTRMEKLLVYEFIPNKSLNYILFDPKDKEN